MLALTMTAPHFSGKISHKWGDIVYHPIRWWGQSLKALDLVLWVEKGVKLTGEEGDPQEAGEGMTANGEGVNRRSRHACQSHARIRALHRTRQCPILLSIPTRWASLLMASLSCQSFSFCPSPPKNIFFCWSWEPLKKDKNSEKEGKGK